MRLAGRVVLVVARAANAGRAGGALQHALAGSAQTRSVGLVGVQMQFEHRAVVDSQGDMAQHRAARRVERDLDLAAVFDAEPPGIGTRQVQVPARVLHTASPGKPQSASVLQGTALGVLTGFPAGSGMLSTMAFGQAAQLAVVAWRSTI